MSNARPFAFGLGQRVRHKVHGFEGVVVARTEWLHGCGGYTVQPVALDKEGNPRESRGFDEDSLELAVPSSPSVAPVPTHTGGPVGSPMRGR